MKTHTINCRQMSTTLFINDIESVDYLTVNHAEFPGYGSVRLRKSLYVIRVYLKNNHSSTFIYDNAHEWHESRQQLQNVINLGY